MADITKCDGNNCPIRAHCWRFTAPDSEQQSWFVKTPGAYDGKEFYCDKYVPEREAGKISPKV